MATREAIDMAPMATYMALKDAALAVQALASRMEPGESFGLAYRTASVGELGNFAAQLRARADEFDVRPMSCTDCGTRHTKAEGCYDGR